MIQMTRLNFSNVAMALSSSIAWLYVFAMVAYPLGIVIVLYKLQMDIATS